MRYELGKRIFRHGKTFVHDITREGPLYAIDHLSLNLSIDKLHQRTTHLVREYAQREAGRPIDVTLPTSTAMSRLLRVHLPEVPPAPHDVLREVNVLTNDNSIDIRAVTRGNTFPLYMRVSYTATGMRVSSGLVDEQASFKSKETQYLSHFAVEVHNGDVLINGVSLSEFADASQIRTKAGRALRQTIHPRIRQMLYIMNAAKPRIAAENNPSVMHFEAARFKLAEVLQIVSPDGTITIHRDTATKQHLPLFRRNEIPSDEIDVKDVPAIREKIVPPQGIVRASSLIQPISLDNLITNLHERDTQNSKIHTATEDFAIARWVDETEEFLRHQAQNETNIGQVLGQSFIADNIVSGLDSVLHPSFDSSSISSSARRRKPRNTRPLDYTTKKLSEVA